MTSDIFLQQCRSQKLLDVLEQNKKETKSSATQLDKSCLQY
jgi:hypothetical protein